MQIKRIKRNLNGVLLLDKPFGITSNGALQRAKRLYQAAKAGHTGNLDPIATGVLPICFGEATKFSQTLLEADKGYRAVIKLGVTTTTGDTEGEVLARQPVAATRADVERVVRRFVGPIDQVPPMYSALKHQGKALYAYAREGVSIAREPRRVVIHSLALEAFAGDELTVAVGCSKGTYIRVLAEDIGAALGCGAHLSALRRTETGGFGIERTLTLDSLEQMTAEERDAALLPMDCLLAGMPRVVLDAESAFYVQRGQAVWQARQVNRGVVSLYGPDEQFLGLGEIAADGKVAPRRLVVE